MRRTVTLVTVALVAVAPITAATAAKPGSSSIALTKTAAAPVDVDGNGIDAGDTIRYTFTLKNTGTRSVSGVQVTDPLLGTVGCSPTTLAAGASATCIPVTYTITQANMDAGSVGSTATATATVSTGGTVTSMKATSTPLAASPAVSFAKSAGEVIDTDGNGTDAGDTIRYTFALANSGNVTLTGVGVTDAPLGTVSCSPTTLAPGASTACGPVTYTITQADLDAGSVGSTATATGTTPKNATVTATSSTSTALITSNRLSVSVSAQPNVDADNDAILDMGDTQPYQYVVTNTGASSLSGVAVTSSLADAVSCPSGSLAPSASVTCTSSHVVNLADVAAGTLTNTATASSGTVTSPSGSAAITFDRMKIALQHGLSSIVSYTELVAKGRATVAAHNNLAATILPNQTMNWLSPAGWRASPITGFDADHQQVLLTGNTGGSDQISLAGTAAGSTTRVGYFSGVPFAQNNGSWAPVSDAGMTAFNINLMAWLMKTGSVTSQRVTLVNVSGSEETQTRNWFASNLPNVVLNSANGCEITTTVPVSTPTCLTPAGSDLILFSSDRGDNPAIRDQLKAAYDSGVPVLMWTDPTYGALSAVTQAFGFSVSGSSGSGLSGSTLATQLPGGKDQFEQTMTTLLDGMVDNPFTVADYQACFNAQKLPTCDAGTAVFDAFVAVAGRWRSMVNALDGRGASIFGRAGNDSDGYRALQLISDKYRTGPTYPGESVPTLTYPVPVKTDPAATARAIFADSAMATAWSGNGRAADTGTLFCSRSASISGNCQQPAGPARADRNVTLKATQNDEWQSTGFDAIAGQPFSVQLTADPGVKVWVRTFFQRSGTTHSEDVDGSNVSGWDRTQWAATAWVPVTASGPITLSTPFGGPLYVRIAGSSSAIGTSVPLHFTNVSSHPTVLDMTDDAQIAAFVDAVDDGAYYADLAGSGFQAHMSVQRIQQALTSASSGDRSVNYTTHGGLLQFLEDYRDQFVFGIYRMAGLQIGDQPLASTNDPDVVTACQNFGLPCLDPALNRRTQIQHVNYDLRANCGNLCSGNPIDSDGTPVPFGWGESHELGHNLQRTQLNIHWADTGANGSNAAAKNVWTNYSNQSGEVSNNIFPYNTYWRFFRKVHPGWGVAGEPNPDTGTLRRDVGGVDAFSIAQSIRSGQASGGILRALDSNCVSHNTTDTTATPVNIAIANALWRPGSATNPGQMSFYQQIPVMMRGKTLADGTVLHDGFGIWTLMYQAARGWSDATSSSSKWTTAAQATYGMSNFAWTNDAVYGTGNDVGDMIGNDFLLIQLSKMTGYDWRPYFQMHGVLYTDLADQQVVGNTPAGGYKSFNNTYPALGAQLPFADMSNIGTVDMTSPSAAWPGAFESSTTTKSKVGFTPSTCP